MFYHFSFFHKSTTKTRKFLKVLKSCYFLLSGHRNVTLLRDFLYALINVSNSINATNFECIYIHSKWVALITDSPPLHFIMASRNTPRAPALLSSCKNFEDWCIMVRVWTKFTDLAPERQGEKIFLLLESQTKDAALELLEDEIRKKDGVKLIMIRISYIKKDDALSKFQTLEVL